VSESQALARENPDAVCKPAFPNDATGRAAVGLRVAYPADPIVEAVLRRIVTRADAGMRVYGQPMTRTDIGTAQWIDHAIEELLDAALYLTRLKENLR
jgi:hypothetical protein